MLRARAIENQSYVIAAAQVGKHNESRVSYGHAVVVDPWGKMIAEAQGYEEWELKKQPSVILADIDIPYLAKIRRETPLRPRRDIIDVVDTSNSIV